MMKDRRPNRLKKLILRNIQKGDKRPVWKLYQDVGVYYNKRNHPNQNIFHHHK